MLAGLWPVHLPGLAIMGAGFGTHRPGQKMTAAARVGTKRKVWAWRHGRAGRRGRHRYRSRGRDQFMGGRQAGCAAMVVHPAVGRRQDDVGHADTLALARFTLTRAAASTLTGPGH
jgi:hypothetical protein